MQDFRKWIMKTDIEIDRLIQEAKKLGRHRTKWRRSAALGEYVQPQATGDTFFCRALRALSGEAKAMR